MTTTGLEVLGWAQDVLQSVSLFNYGTVVLWVIMSFVLGNWMSNEKGDKIAGSAVLLLAGGILIFADTSNKVIILIAVILTIIFGFFKILRRKK